MCGAEDFFVYRNCFPVRREYFSQVSRLYLTFTKNPQKPDLKFTIWRNRKMMNASKYKRQYYLPPETCMDWAKKDYIDKAPTW